MRQRLGRWMVSFDSAGGEPPPGSMQAIEPAAPGGNGRHVKDKLLDLARRDRECSEALVASWGREPGWAFLVEQAHRLGDELDRAIDENLSWLELEAEASLRHFSQQLFAARTELTVAAGLGDADRFGRTALWRARAAVLRTRHEVEPIVARCLVGT